MAATFAPSSPAAPEPVRVRLVEGAVPAGFPSPADDFATAEIDLARTLVPRPQSTFFVRASGWSMRHAGIHDGDMLIVDRAIPPRPGHIVVAVVDGEFTVKHLRARGGRPFLEPANPRFPCIHPRDGQSLEVFGVVTHSVTSHARA